MSHHRRWPLLAIIAIALGVGAHQWRFAASLQDGLSPIANSYAEAETIRAGESFATRGFTYAWGLPDYYYGNQFADVGGKPKAPPGKLEYIYTHNPQGADWIAGAATLIFGVGNIGKFRIIPIVLGVIGLLVLALGLWRFFEGRPWQAVAALAITFTFPMTYNMIHGLHHHGYATTLYFGQLGLLLVITANGFQLTRTHAIALAGLGFLQGWFSLDYFPLVALSSIAVSIAWWHLRAPTTSLREHLVLVMLPIGGYATAFGMHVLEVAAYHGSLRAAIDDFAGVAIYRTSVTAAGTQTIGHFQLLWQYIVQFLPRKRFIGTPLLESVSLFVTLTFVSRTWWRLSAGKAQPRPVTLDIRWSALPAVFITFFIGALWVLVMTNHAWSHGNYIPRNFQLVYLMMVYLVIDGLKFGTRTQD